MISKAFLWMVSLLAVVFLSGCPSGTQLAAVTGSASLLDASIKRGEDINKKNFRGDHPLLSATGTGKIENVRMLINRGAKLDIQNNGGITALMSASFLGHTDIAKLLVESGANIDLEDNVGNTALMLASYKGAIDIVNLLIKRKARLDIRNVKGNTALDIAVIANRYTVAEMLRSAGASSTGAGKNLQPGAAPSPSSPLSTSVSTSTGTGWVTEGGYIVTNQHVIDGHTRITVRFNGSGDKEYPAEVVIADESNDLAVLKINSPNGTKPKGLPIAAKLPRIGAEVFTIGYPKSDVMGLNPKVTNGIVSALSGIKDDPRVIQTTVAIQSGNSGGPLFNMKGEVIGITMASLRTRVTTKGVDVPQGVNYAIKSGYASTLLASVPERAYPMEQPTSASLEELIPRVQDSIVQVTVTSNDRSE